MAATFKIEPAPTFAATVKISAPGVAEPLPLELVFKWRSRSALAEWLKNADGKADPEFVGEALAGWGNVVDADDKPVPFGAEALAQLLDNFPAAADEITRAYLAELIEAREKN